MGMVRKRKPQDRCLAMKKYYTYDELDELLRGDGSHGKIGLSAIDGLIAALIAGPAFVRPEEWLPLIFGGRQPAALEGSPEHLATNTIFARYNQVLRGLSDHPKTYQPIFMVDQGTFIVRDWVVGFMLGVGQRLDLWAGFILKHRRDTLAHILAVYSDFGQDFLMDVMRAEKERLKADAHLHIPDAVIAVDTLCTPQRPVAVRSQKPTRQRRK